MRRLICLSIVTVGTALGAPTCFADALVTRRIPAALAVEAASEAITTCEKQGYNETAVVVDADGVTIAAVRGDGTVPIPLIVPMTRRTRLLHSSTTHLRSRSAGAKSAISRSSPT